MGKGSYSVWWDNWLPAVPLRQPPNSSIQFVRDIFDVDQAVSASTMDDLGPRAVHAIEHNSISLSDTLDIPCWSRSSNGSFSLSVAWQLVRKAHPTLSSSSFIWHRHLPKKVSIFMWRLFLFRLLLDKSLWRKGVQLASNCACCHTSNI